MRFWIRRVSIICILAVCCCGCTKQSSSNHTSVSTDKKEKLPIPKISEKELSAMKRTAMKELKKKDYDVVKAEFNPEYYKKIYYDSYEEYMENCTGDGDYKKYKPNIIAVQVYEKEQYAADLVIFAKVKGKWRYLYEFK